MKIYTIDFVTPTEGSHVLNIEGNYIGFNSICVFSKEPFEYNIDIRMVIQTEYDLDSMKNTNEIAGIVEPIVRNLLLKYFLDKTNEYIFDKHQILQEELSELLQLEFIKHNFKIEMFVISYIEKGFY